MLKIRSTGKRMHDRCAVPMGYIVRGPGGQSFSLGTALTNRVETGAQDLFFACIKEIKRKNFENF
jgi:hypothetical protein